MASSATIKTENVGIHGIYVYFPRLVVQQEDLEAVDGCCGKYTVGLGQQAMTFCGDREDVVSMAATAVLRLLDSLGILPKDIGKLEVGTETGVDRSKSVMSYLVEYFTSAGNTTLQGSDHTHGCYGGTAALFSVADWVCSPSWDGRLGLVVATDIAMYPENSPARPTGGGGAAALLLGPDAPLVLEPWPWRSHFSAHTFDFFKPHGHPLYPVVDGPATTLWFTKAADACAAQLYRQLHPLLEQDQQQGPAAGASAQQQTSLPGLLQHFDYFVSHAPYNKIVRKIFARMVLQDMLRADQWQQQQQQQETLFTTGRGSSNHGGRSAAASAVAASSASNGSSKMQVGHQDNPFMLPPLPGEAVGLDPDVLPESSIYNKALETAVMDASSELYHRNVEPSAWLQRQLGNLYTASLYTGMAGLLDFTRGKGLEGKKVLCFSFGSGVVASMFVLRGRDATTNQQQQQQEQTAGVAGSQQQQQRRELPHRASASSSAATGQAQHGEQPMSQMPDLQQQPWRRQQQGWRQHLPLTLQEMFEKLQIRGRLSKRCFCSVQDFDDAMASLRKAYGAASYSPGYGKLEDLEEDVVYLESITDFRRFYKQR